MACDGRHLNFIVDTDGTLFTEGPATIIADSTRNWAPIPGEDTSDINAIYGLGYYRVPRELKTTLDGELIPEETLIAERGMYNLVSYNHHALTN